jgi:hypothetical protein
MAWVVVPGPDDGEAAESWSACSMVSFVTVMVPASFR